MDIMDYYVAAYHDVKFTKLFESYIQVGNIPDIDCWIWTGGTTHTGYGTIGYKYKMLRVHRVMYMFTTHRYPRDLHIHHICGNKLCISPYHLEALTPQEHVFKEKWSTHCKRGHEWTSDNTFINSFGKRVCRTCKRKREREYLQSKRR